MNKWAGLTPLAAVQPEKADASWEDRDRAVLEHMREILGVALFSGCGQPDCFDCAED